MMVERRVSDLSDGLCPWMRENELGWAHHPPQMSHHLTHPTLLTAASSASSDNRGLADIPYIYVPRYVLYKSYIGKRKYQYYSTVGLKTAGKEVKNRYPAIIPFSSGNPIFHLCGLMRCHISRRLMIEIGRGIEIWWVTAAMASAFPIS